MFNCYLGETLIFKANYAKWLSIHNVSQTHLVSTVKQQEYRHFVKSLSKKVYMMHLIPPNGRVV